MARGAAAVRRAIHPFAGGAAAGESVRRPAEEYFADGTTDELITELARVPNLRVVSRSSVMQENGKLKSLAQLSNELHVDAMVDGSVMRSGDRVRITARLVDTRSDEHLWARTFEGSASNILQLEDIVAEEIAAHARVTLIGPINAKVVNPAAHDAYLRAIYFLNQRNASISLRYFREAVALDPGYASAYAGLASALESAYLLGAARPEDVSAEAMEAARKAIALDPENGEAYTALGSLEMTAAWDIKAAQRDLHRGVDLNPGNSYGQMKYAILLDALNQPNEAVTYMRRGPGPGPALIRYEPAHGIDALLRPAI